MDKRKSFVIPDSIEIASIERIAQKLTNQNGHWYGDAGFPWLEDNDLPMRCKSRQSLTCSYRDDPIFSRNVTSETFSKTYLKTGQIQDC